MNMIKLYLLVAVSVLLGGCSPSYDPVQLWPKNSYFVLESCDHKGTNMLNHDIFHCVLHNNTEHEVQLIRLRVDYYDSSGIKVGGELGFSPDAAPGERVRIQMTPPPETRAIKAVFKDIDLSMLD